MKSVNSLASSSCQCNQNCSHVCCEKDYSQNPSASAVAETGCLAAGPNHAIPNLQCTVQE